MNHHPRNLPLVLRQSEPDDIPDIASIYGHAVRHGRASFEIEPPSTEEMAARRRALIEAGFPYVVAELDGAVAGYAYAGAYRPRPAYGATVEDSVYVAERFQGLGIGRTLLARLIVLSEEAGFRQMIAAIGDSANAASIRLHQSLGFTQAGLLRSVGWKHGQWLDVVLMQRPLGPGDGAPR